METYTLEWVKTYPTKYIPLLRAEAPQVRGLTAVTLFVPPRSGTSGAKNRVLWAGSICVRRREPLITRRRG
jgi:hypothetical protein